MEGFRYDPEAGELRTEDGSNVPLRPQTLRVLDVLVANAGDLVTKDTLMETVWPDTHVTDDSLVQCIAEIRKALGSDASKRLKTIPKQGYRLDAIPEDSRPPAVRPKVRGFRFGWVMAALAIIAGFGIALLSLSGPSQPTDPPAIAVLPFENLSGEDEQSYFSDGLSEELIVNLSRISDLRVVSRSASFFVAGQVADPRRIAEELGVTFLVEGSVRRSGETLWISAALVDGATGENVWARAYSGTNANIFEFQTSVMEELIRALSVRLSSAERARLGVYGTSDVEAFDHYLRGLALANFLRPEANQRAEEQFVTALRLDPGYASAHAQVSLVLSMRAEFGWTTDVSGAVARAKTHADEAVTLAPDSPFAHFAQGRLLSRRFIGDLEGASAAFQRAIDLDPNYTDAYAFDAIVQIADGRAEQGLAMIRDAFEKNPIPPYWYYMPLGLAQFVLEDYAAAESALTELLQRNPNLPNAMRLLMATYGHQGRVDDAEWLAFEYEMLDSSATITDLMETTNLRHPPYRDALEQGLRKAGLPE